MKIRHARNVGRVLTSRTKSSFAFWGIIFEFFSVGHLTNLQQIRFYPIGLVDKPMGSPCCYALLAETYVVERIVLVEAHSKPMLDSIVKKRWLY